MRLLIVTPIHNEKRNIPLLARSLIISSRRPDTWIVVDDGSDDGGSDFLSDQALPFEFHLVRHQNDGGLIGGSAFKAWQFGVDYANSAGTEFDAVMKLDADVDLPPCYLRSVLDLLESDTEIGLAGGVLAGARDREQVLQVPGPVKMYSRRGYEALDQVPRAVGFDVMDEHAIALAGLKVQVMRDLRFGVRRAIGASQGRIHGRRRNGLVCRWSGYWPPYFALHALRYIFRRPYLVGSIAMIAGYLSAGRGPYSADLLDRNKNWQKQKLHDAVTHPVEWFREAYGVD